MSDTLWWTLLVILIISITIFCVHLVYSIIKSVCVKKPNKTNVVLDQPMFLQQTYKFTPVETFEEYSVVTDEVDSEIAHIFERSEKGGISKSVDDLECCDPEGIDTLKCISELKEEAMKVRDSFSDMPEGFLNKSDVLYLKFRGKLLNLGIQLRQLRCDTDDLKKARANAVEFVQECLALIQETSEDPPP